MEKYKKKNRIWISIVLYMMFILLLQFGNIFISRSHPELSMLNGVIMATQFAVCLLMVRVDTRRGYIVTLVFLGYNILVLCLQMLGGNFGIVPGLGNAIVYIISITILYRLLSNREKEAITDSLTGLINRRGLFRVINERVSGKQNFYVIYIEIDNFKLINDNFGHNYGDAVLKEIAKRIHASVDKRDLLARISGYEFVIVLDGHKEPAAIAAKVLSDLSERTNVRLNDNEIECYLNAHAGISCFPKDSKDADTLVKYADLAMSQAENNPSRYCFFDSSMENYLQRQMDLEKRIKNALENDKFYMMYQPQYKIEGKVLRGFEALIRLESENDEYVSPAEFIPIAERSDLILQIDDYVIRHTLKEFKRIVDITGEKLVVSVNVSAKNIGQKHFCEKIRDYLSEAKFPPQCLEIEITEYCLVQSIDATIENIKELRKMGVQVALDDFGTGYTSLFYLAKMPINLLKVDKSLVDEIEIDRKRLDFVKTIISMGHLMGCEVISEGVETEEQIILLKNQDCDFIQGYVWAKPMKFTSIQEIVEKYYIDL